LTTKLHMYIEMTPVLPLAIKAIFTMALTSL